MTSGREVEVSLDHGDTEDSDDLPEEEEHRGTNGNSHHNNHITVVSCKYTPPLATLALVQSAGGGAYMRDATFSLAAHIITITLLLSQLSQDSHGHVNLFDCHVIVTYMYLCTPSLNTYSANCHVTYYCHAYLMIHVT